MRKGVDTSSGAEDRLTRLGQEWFAEVRRKNADQDAKPARSRDSGDGGSDGDGSLWDWLFGGDGADGADGGDGGD